MDEILAYVAITLTLSCVGVIVYVFIKDKNN